MKIFVGGLNFETTDEDLRHYFQTFRNLKQTLVAFGIVNKLQCLSMPFDQPGIHVTVTSTDGFRGIM